MKVLGSEKKILQRKERKEREAAGDYQERERERAGRPLATQPRR